MSRNNGSFPHYIKIDVDPDRWPANYWDSSRKCTECGFGWPSVHLFISSPCCQAPTILDKNMTPGLRWPEALNQLFRSRFERYYEEYNEGATDEELLWSDVRTNGRIDENKIKDVIEDVIETASDSNPVID